MAKICGASSNLKSMGANTVSHEIFDVLVIGAGPNG